MEKILLNSFGGWGRTTCITDGETVETWFDGTGWDGAGGPRKLGEMPLIGEGVFDFMDSQSPNWKNHGQEIPYGVPDMCQKWAMELYFKKAHNIRVKKLENNRPDGQIIVYSLEWGYDSNGMGKYIFTKELELVQYENVYPAIMSSGV